MPSFADAYISSLGYLRPYVLFENNGELASKASARERARRARKKNLPPLSPCTGGLYLSPDGVGRENRGSVNRLRKYSQV